MKKFLKYLLVLIVPLLILDLVLIIKYGFDGFSNLFIIEDMNTQYMSLMRWIQDVLQGHESIFYSFSKGIGGNMFSTFAYYLSSPLNVILMFFSRYSYVIAICLLIHIKIGLSSLTMFIFLKNKYKDKNFLYLLLFSTIYSLSGAVVNFYSNIMWLDIVYFTPLVMMGLDKIIQGKKSYLYIIFLAFAIISNFYMGYILCIFCLIYYIYQTIITYKKEDKMIIRSNTKRFILYSLLAVLISCIILVPLVFDMSRNIYRYELNKPIFYFDIDSLSMIFAKSLIGSMSVDTMYSHYEANVYITLFSLLLVVTYFFDKKNTKKEKIATASVIFLFILSIAFNAFNLVWHGFSFPNGYNYRFVFFYSFFLINIACKEFLSITQYNKFDKSLLKYLITVLFLVFLIVYNKYTYLSSIKIILSLIFIIVYLLYIYKNKKFQIRPIFIFLLVIFELAININYAFITKKSINKLYNDLLGVTVLEDVSYFSKELCLFRANTSGYRVDMERVLSYNDSFICNDSSITTALSTNHANYYQFLSDAGYSVTYSTVLNDYANGPFIDSILGLKYIIRLNPNFQTYYKFYNKTEISIDETANPATFIQYQNPYVLNLGYVIDENANISFNKNAFEYQNDLAKAMSGLNIDIFEKVETEEIRTTSDKVQILRFYAENKNYYVYNYVPVPINTTYYGTFDIEQIKIHEYIAGDNGIVAIEEHPINQDITVTYTSSEDYKDYIDVQIYSFNQDNFEKIINKLKEDQLNVTKRRGNILEGNIDISKDDSLMMLSIPYEKGWNIYVDGEKIDYEEVYDTFVGIRLDKGSHEIKMVFYSPGIVVGSMLTLTGFIILFVMMYNDKDIKSKYKNIYQKLSKEIVSK